MEIESEEFLDDMKWGEENYSELMRKYPGKWVAIVSKKVIGIGRSMSEAEEEAHWRSLKIKILATGYSMRGIIPREECKLPVDMGEIYCILLDEKGNRIKETKIYAFLAFSDIIPIVLGFKFLLERFKICFDCEEGNAWLEEKERKNY
jgi:hypothetical protein